VSSQPPLPPPSAIPPPLPSNPPPVPPHPSLNRKSSKEVSDSAVAAQSFPTYRETNNPFITPEPETTANVHNESQLSDKSTPILTKRDSQSAIDDIKDEVDDTMRNLRKTFAGIFGDM